MCLFVLYRGCWLFGINHLRLGFGITGPHNVQQVLRELLLNLPDGQIVGIVSKGVLDLNANRVDSKESKSDQGGGHKRVGAKGLEQGEG